MTSENLQPETGSMEMVGFNPIVIVLTKKVLLL